MRTMLSQAQLLELQTMFQHGMSHAGIEAKAVQFLVASVGPGDYIV